MIELLLSALLFLSVHGLIAPQGADNTGAQRMDYKGTPYTDSVSVFSIQKIPGRVKCAFYDLGGEGVAYHDSDIKNNGSGSLNKGPGYLNNFRANEAVDVSYTKFHDTIDNSVYSKVQPKIDQLYLGWTEPGEWTKYTVEVMESADFKVGVMYTSNRGGAIRLCVDNTDSTSLLDIPTTFDAADTLAWRQWHHWNCLDSLTVLHLAKGKRVITLEISKQGNFNFDYFEFRKVSNMEDGKW